MCFALPFVLACFGFTVSFVLVAVVGRYIHKRIQRFT